MKFYSRCVLNVFTLIYLGRGVLSEIGNKHLKFKRDVQARNNCLRIKEWVVSEATGISDIAQEDLIKGEENGGKGRTLENFNI